MNQNSSGMSCAITCWLIAALAGILIAALLMVQGDWAFLPATMLGGLAFVLGGLFLSWAFCMGSGAQSAEASSGSSSAAGNAGSNTAATAAPAAAAATATAAAAGDATMATPLVSSTATTSEPAPKAAPTPKAAPKAEPKAKAAPKAAAKPKAKTEAKAPAKPKQPAVAKDGQPELLSKARAGGADDLKQIKGVGPGLEKTLNELGFYHFDQIAGWRKKEVEWVDSRLKFKGRIERDDWIKQCKTLAKGGTTEFSNKVKKGDVY